MTKAKSDSDFTCRVFFLGLSSFMGITFMLFALGQYPVQIVDRWAVWLSIPWFAFWYLACRVMHRTVIVFR